jgi:hypothetical protein
MQIRRYLLTNANTALVIAMSALFATPSAYAQTAPQVRATVGHFAPFAATLDGTSVTVRVNGVIALSNVKFGEFTEYLNLGPAGAYKIEVLPTGSTTVAITQDLNLMAGDYTVLAVGGANSQDLALLALSDNNTAPAAGKAKVRVIHAAPFAAGAATGVSIRNESNAVVGGLDNVSFKTASGYLEVSAGRLDLAVANPAGTQTFIDVKPVTLSAGSITTVIATGGGNNQALGITGIAAGAAPRNALPVFTLGPVKVRAVHLAPFAATLAATAVNIKVNGAQILTDVRYKQFSGVLDLPAQGSYKFEVIPAGATAAAITQFVDLDGNKSFNVAAVGDGNNQPLALLSTEQNTVAPAADKYKLQVIHTAPFAKAIDATRVSIRTDGGDVVGGLNNVPYLGASGLLELGVGALDIKVSTPNGQTNLIDPAAFTLPAGANAVAYAVGDGVNQPVGIVAVPVGDLPLEKAVDFSVGGHWFEATKSGQGIDFLPIPRENRLLATWYTFAADGSGPRWYIMDTCRSAVGAATCPQAGAFNGQSAQMSIYEATGGRLNTAGGVTSREVGVFNVTFADCKVATANFQFTGTGAPSGTMNLTALIVGAGCQ